MLGENSGKTWAGSGAGLLSPLDSPDNRLPLFANTLDSVRGGHEMKVGPVSG